jgi:hypothetical protein
MCSAGLDETWIAGHAGPLQVSSRPARIDSLFKRKWGVF